MLLPYTFEVMKIQNKSVKTDNWSLLSPMSVFWIEKLFAGYYVLLSTAKATSLKCLVSIIIPVTLCYNIYCDFERMLNKMKNVYGLRSQNDYISALNQYYRIAK